MRGALSNREVDVSATNGALGKRSTKGHPVVDSSEDAPNNYVRRKCRRQLISLPVVRWCCLFESSVDAHLPTCTHAVHQIEHSTLTKLTKPTNVSLVSRFAESE